MSLGTWLRSWPAMRQIALNDRLGLGRAAQSARSENLVPRTRTADKVVQPDLVSRHMKDTHATCFHFARADQLKLDVERLWDQLRRHVHAPRIAQDVAIAYTSGVSGTPTFFINSRRHPGAYDIETLTEAVRAAREVERLAASR
jgi:hypothetical protein